MSNQPSDHPEDPFEQDAVSNRASQNDTAPNETGPNDTDSDLAAADDAFSQLVNHGLESETLEHLRAERDALADRVARVQAELENYRKRAQRSLEEERRYAALPLMRDLLSVVDNLQRAIDAAQQNHDTAGLLEGVKMVAGQLGSILKQHNCEEIPAEGEPFDPNYHEAISQLPSDEHEAGQVMHVTQAGYRLHGRVVRPSQVIVVAPKSADE